MKKLILGSLVLSSVVFGSVNDYKRGFENAIESIRVQIKNNSIVPKIITFKGTEAIYIKTNKLDTVNLMLLQFLAKEDNFNEIYITKDRLYLGSYNRPADSNYYMKKAKELYGLEVYKIKTNNLIEYTNPLFFKNIMNNIRKNLTNEGILIEPKIIEKKVYVNKYIKPKKIHKKSRFREKFFTLKNQKAQTYYLENGWQNGAYKQSSNFKELELVEKGNKYKYARTLRAIDGKVFIKVYKKNIYFLNTDIKY